MSGANTKVQGCFIGTNAAGSAAVPNEQLKAENVTSGCGDGTVYCPANPNTRGQMATFLVKALGLP